MYRGNHGNPQWYMGSMLAALTLWNTHTGTEQLTIYIHQWSTTKVLAFSADSTDVGTLGDCTYTRVYSTGFDPHRNLHSSTSNLAPRLPPSVERSSLGSRRSNSAAQWVPILAWIQSSPRSYARVWARIQSSWMKWIEWAQTLITCSTKVSYSKT